MIYVKDLDTAIKYKINYHDKLEQCVKTVGSTNIIQIDSYEFNRNEE